MQPRHDRLLYALALAVGAAPLWAGRHLPLVDLPQHLHLISVLHRLGDPTTIYPQVFELRGELTPYLGYYYLVSLLNWLVPLELANRLFLTAYVVALPLSLALLLHALRRPTWPSLLALPFAYGDSFAWGFVNFCAALPLAIAACALFAMAISDARRRTIWSALLAVDSVAALLFHVQGYAFMAVGLPFLLLTTRAPEDDQPWPVRLRARAAAVIGVLPSVALFLAWVVLRLGQPPEIAPGQPWKAWGPVLSPENLAYKSFEQNRHELFGVLANQLRDGSDAWAVWAVAAVAIAGVLLAASGWLKHPPIDHPTERLRMLGLTALALALFFALPFDIRGFSYYVNTRYAHLAAALAVASVPAVASLAHRRWLLSASAAASLVLCVPLWRGYAEFGEEASSLDRLAALTLPKPRVMGLIFDTGSRVVTHPVFLHAAAVLARERGGLANFSFALTPHSPIKYRIEPPPTYASEWRPDGFRYDVQGPSYDHFLIRGAQPAQVLDGHLDGELGIAGQSGGFWLVRRRGAHP